MQTNSPEATRSHPVVPPSRYPDRAADESGAPGTYVADSFTGDVAMTSGGRPALARDGEPAGLARVTLAMRKPAQPSSPAPRRLAGLCSWAASVGIIGCVVAIRAGITVVIGAPSWFVPTAAGIGLAGVGCTIGAFVVARQRVVPWALLGIATGSLLAATIVTSAVS